MTTHQKRQEHYRRDNLEAARRILEDPRYVEGSLMKMWATSYLKKHAEELSKERKASKRTLQEEHHARQNSESNGSTLWRGT
jgi:hypothetical protein